MAKLIVGINDLWTTHAHIAAKIINDDPKTLTKGMRKEVISKCSDCSHEWPARVDSLTSGSGCPCCAGQKAVPSNCLATTHPEIAAQWDYEKNGDLKPRDVMAGSNKKVHWKCNVAEDHRWVASPNNRKNNHGCPCCAGKKVVLSNCLATTHPHLLSQWDYEKNGDLKPRDVMAGSNKKVHWKCNVAEDHRWEACPNSLSNGQGCPCCAASKGEELIAKILEEKGIIFTRQWSAKDCRHKRSLPFDFAVMVEGNMVALIEYQGKQHYQSVEWFGGEKTLAETQHRDAIKRTYCQTNNIPLLEVHYEWRETENKVEKELVKFLTSLGL